MADTGSRPDEQPGIRRVREREVFGNRFITVYDDDVTMTDDRPGRYLRIVEGQGRPGVAVLAVCADRYALVRTFRYPLDAWEWGIPRGFGKDDDPAKTARTELLEELGGYPRELVPLGVVAPNSGILSGRVHLYLARFDEPVNAPQDIEEVSEVRWMGLPELLAEIRQGNINDGFTLSAVTAAMAHGRLSL